MSIIEPNTTNDNTDDITLDDVIIEIVKKKKLYLY